MSYRGDIALGATLDLKFTTRRFSTGAPHAWAGSPAVACYVDNGTTEITAGITLTNDFDGRTGLHNVRIVATSGNGYAAGTNVDVVVTSGTVDSVSIVGEVVGSFSIEARSSLRPTTAGRTLDVSAGGEAGLDWANVGSPSTVVGLSGTTIKTATDVETDTADIQSRLPAALVSGRMDASVGAMAANVLTAAAIAADAITDAKVASDVTIAGVTGAVGSVTGNVGGNVSGSVGSIAAGGIAAASFGAGAIDATAIAANAITAAKIATDAIDADAIAADAVSEIQAGLSTLNAAGVRTAVGLASANLDTQLDALPTNAELAMALAAADDAVLAAIAVLPQDKTGYALTSAYDFAKGTVAMSESYAAQGAAATPIQALYMALQLLAERSISGTQLVVKKLDGTTAAMTFTLDSGTTPTAQTRAT